MGYPVPKIKIDNKNNYTITNPDRDDKKDIPIKPNFKTKEGLDGFVVSGSGLTTWGLEKYGETDKFPDSKSIPSTKIAVALLDKGEVVGILLGRKNKDSITFDRIQDSKGIMRSLSDDKMIEHGKDGDKIVANNEAKHLQIKVKLVQSSNIHNLEKDVLIPQKVADELGKFVTKKTGYNNEKRSEIPQDMQNALAQALDSNNKHVSGTAPIVAKTSSKGSGHQL